MQSCASHRSAVLVYCFQGLADEGFLMDDLIGESAPGVSRSASEHMPVSSAFGPIGQKDRMSDQPQQSAVAAFWAELNRRRVVRVVVLYAIGGWIVIEVTSTISPNLGLPDWTVKLVTVLVVLGFVIAIVLAWAFDIGPGGVHRTASTDDAGVDQDAAASAESVEVVDQIDQSPLAVDGRKSIAVLPFVNLSGDVENEYFSDGISEEILNLMVKLPKLRVASRTSSFMFKGKEVSIPTVAKELGVDTVLEGSVRRAGDRVRITAQLIDSSTDSHLWSETYDREMQDVFAIQDDIAQSITGALEMALNPKERRAIQNVATSNSTAYDFYLRGRSYMFTMTRRDFEYAIRMFQQAIDVDAMYALAYAGLADGHSRMFRYADGSRENAEMAQVASEKAIALDPDSAEAHASHGLAMFINEEYAKAEREFETAIELNPNLFESYFYYGQTLSSQGAFEKAAEMYLKAMDVNPADYQSRVFLAQAYASLGRKQEEMKARLASLELIQRHLDMNPHDTRALYVGANQMCAVGDKEKGLELAERALGQDDKEPVVLYNVACFYSIQGDLEQAMELLARAVELGWGDRAWLETDSDLDPLRQDPRFISLLEGMQ
jgi:adenylate cyclase